MQVIAICLACRALYEASEEESNAPDHVCAGCYKKGVRLDCVGNRLRRETRATPTSSVPRVLRAHRP